jgi:hypothetical protein
MRAEAAGHVFRVIISDDDPEQPFESVRKSIEFVSDFGSAVLSLAFGNALRWGNILPASWAAH